MNLKIKITRAVRYEKKWGYEDWIYNGPEYCGKILHFNADSKFSYHFHLMKTETWYVQSGEFILHYKNLNTGADCTAVLLQGDVIHIPPGNPHQLVTAIGGDIFEVSTEHYECDSYRIAPGDSQK